MYREDLALNNLQGLICFKTHPIKSNQIVTDRTFTTEISTE